MKLEPPPSVQYRQIFLEWYHVTTLGQILQTIEASYLQSSLKLTYNQKTLQVGQLGSEALYIDGDFMGDFTLIDSAPSHSVARKVAAFPSELPIASNSIDTVILPHVVEFDAHRHQVLREVERVLKPEGRLFLLSLNPWSVHGSLQYLPRKSSFWQANFVSGQRVLDWLSLLNFEAEISAAFALSTSRIITKPDSALAKLRAALSFSYAIKATKRRYSLIPIEPNWLAVPSLAPGHMLEKTCMRKSAPHE